MPIVLCQYMLDENYFNHPCKKRKIKVSKTDNIQLKSKPIKISKTKSKVFTFSKHDIRMSQFHCLNISQREFEKSP